METQQTPAGFLDHLETHLIVAGNFQKACDLLVQWATDKDLRREQIISISANETTTVDADAVLTVIFKKMQEPDMTTPLSGLQYHLIKNTVDWDVQYQEFTQILAQPCEVVALTHTARNIGQINIQILFYLPGRGGRNTYTAKHFETKGQDDISLVLDQALLYVNTYVTPQNLVSFSVFEDDHPCPNKFYHVVVLHKGAEPTAPF